MLIILTHFQYICKLSTFGLGGDTGFPWVETGTCEAYVQVDMLPQTEDRTGKDMKYLPKKEMEHLMPEIGEKEKKTVISVVGKREWDPSLGRWLFWEWTETWILVHGRETSFALWEVERWRREVDLINLQPAAVYYCLGQLLLDILLGVLKMFSTSQMAIFLMQKPKCSIFSECKKWDTKDYYRLHFEIRLIFKHVWLSFLLLFFINFTDHFVLIPDKEEQLTF